MFWLSITVLYSLPQNTQPQPKYTEEAQVMALYLIS